MLGCWNRATASASDRKRPAAPPQRRVQGGVGLRRDPFSHAPTPHLIGAKQLHELGLVEILGLREDLPDIAAPSRDVELPRRRGRDRGRTATLARLTRLS